MSIDTVIFDLDGVIIDTEQVWHEVRRDFALAHGGHWDEHDQIAVMGDNSTQWVAHMREESAVALPGQEIYAGVIGGLRERYARHLPLIPGAREALLRVAAEYRLGVASSSPPELIEDALRLAGLREYFTVVVSSDEVAHGKPAPDVYLEACARLGSTPEHAAAVEDSSNGILAAAAAGLAVIAVPNAEFPPTSEALAAVDARLGSIGELTPEVVAALRPGKAVEARGADHGR